MNLDNIITELEKRFDKWETRSQQIYKALNYLKEYGYLAALDKVTLGDIYRAIVKFQEFADITVDGEVGPETLGKIDLPRCGNPDFAVDDSGNIISLERKYGKWKYHDLAFCIESRDKDLGDAVWDNLLTTAFSAWSDVADLNFNRVDNPSRAQLVMSIGQGSKDHFDGPFGTLAWAQLPPVDNYMGRLLCKFDVDETWRESLADGEGILLLNVACHEIGHLLGLGHSEVNTALMAPFYNPNVNSPQSRDDVSKIQSIYGVPKEKPKPPKAPENLSVRIIPTAATESVSERNEIDSWLQLRWEHDEAPEGTVEKFEVFENDGYIGWIKGSITVVEFGPVKPGSYTYKVRALKNDLYSEWSNKVSITIEEPEPEPEPGEGEEITITFKGDVEIKIPGYTITKKS